ncbi:MAG: hypothetical protein PVF45_13895 [Anaerolineae bacterium]|jgi:hypothetical protein
MNTSGTGKRPRRRKNIRPSFTDGCYAVPIRFLYGTAAEINFWDVVYFGAHQAGGAFETSTQELVQQTGLSRQMVGRLRRQAIERGELAEDVSWGSGRRFVLRLPGWPPKKGVIWKPLGYVRHDWHHAVTPAIPKRVLNLYLQQPRQQVYRLETNYIAAKCKRRFPKDKYRPVAPLNSADVGRALRLLVRLGLLTPEENGFRIAWETFNRSAPLEGPSFDAPDPREHPLFRQAAAAAPRRAERALELLDMGHYDVDTHLSAIVRDLAYVRDDDYSLLKAKVHRHRNRPPGPNRWRDTWRAFQYELKRRVSEIQAPKNVLNLGEATSLACALALDLGQAPGRVLAVRMVSRVEWPWHLSAPAGAQSNDGPRAPAVRLELRSGREALFRRTVRPNDAEVRYTLHPDKWPGSAPLTLAAHCDRPLPGVHVEVWLEARLRR